MRFSPVMLAAVFAASVVVSAAEPAGFSVHDLVVMQRVSDPRLSPDGRSVVFVVRETDLDAGRGRTDLWRVGTDGSGLRRLTSHPENDSAPLWSPDGRSIYFLSGRSGSSQIWRLPADGGEAEPITAEPLEISTFTLSRDGTRLAYSMEVFPDCTEIDCTTARITENESRKSSARVYERLFVRHWDTWKDGRRSHLYVRPVAGGAALDVMRGMDADCPSKPFGGVEEYTFTPDGQGLVFTARDAGREEAWSTNFDLWQAPIDGSSLPQRLTAGNPAWDTQPVFSPDGKRLAWLAMSRAGYEADRFRIMIREWPDGAERVLADDWDRSPGTIRWSEDGRSILAIAANVGNESLFAIDLKSGRVRTLVDKGHVAGLTVARGQLVYALDHLQAPVDLYATKPDGTGTRQITRFNAERLANVVFGEPEPFSFSGWNAETVHGWVVKPANFDATRRWPVAFLIHGGPQGSFDNHFHYRWNPQVYAGAGYAAVMINFHGSTGYGQAFTDSIRGDWGGKPLEDLKKGLDSVLTRYPWMDHDRVAALGASYGGYMVNWIAGQWPDRFRCLVNHDGNLDERGAYFDTEELWFPEWEHGGTPWSAPEGFAKHNPIDYVDRWRTPMLVIHGAKDYRVVDTQGLSTFTALQRRGIPSKLVYFPDENHWVLEPHNSIFWHETVLDWLDRWTRSATPGNGR